jgi:hypothetical protein
MNVNDICEGLAYCTPWRAFPTSSLHTRSSKSEMNNTLSTFSRLSGDTGAFAAISGEGVMFSATDQRLTKKQERKAREQERTYTYTRQSRKTAG